MDEPSSTATAPDTSLTTPTPPVATDTTAPATAAAAAVATPSESGTGTAEPAQSSDPSQGTASEQQPAESRKGPTIRELRRARIVITVRRTEGYKQWLKENPLQAVIAGDGDDDVGVDTAVLEETAAASGSSKAKKPPVSRDA